MLIKDALLYGKKFLSESSSSAFLDSLVLLKFITGLTKEKILLSDAQISPEAFDNFCALLIKRKNFMPIQYIINSTQFMGLDFYVDQNVLIPRADTEILVENAIEFIGGKKVNVLELCTGSGCIGIALKKFCPNINIYCVDVSQDAIDIAKKNALYNGVDIEFKCADIFEEFASDIPPIFDIIISNPPYINSEQIFKLDKCVKDYEPIIALDGGKDGLKFYSFIAQKISHKCKLFLEIGCDQAQSVSNILLENNFVNIKVVKDLAGLNRVIYADKE